LKVDIGNLLQLQTIDLEISKLDEEMLNGVADLEERQKTIDERKVTIAELEEKLVSCEARRRELDAEVEDESARIKDRQTKLMNVQTNREYQSILKEIEDAKRGVKQREDEGLQLIERVDTINTRVEEQKNLCEAEEALLAEATAEVDAATKKLTAKKTKVVKSRTAKVKDVDAALLKRYELLCSRREGQALAGVTDGVCKGCYMNIPPQMFIELQKEEEMLSCPTCNRIMFFERAVEEEA